MDNGDDKDSQPTLNGLDLRPIIIDEFVEFKPTFIHPNSKLNSDPYDAMIYGLMGGLPIGYTLPPGNINYVGGVDKAFSPAHFCSQDDWVNVGFHHDKFVCRVCDKEKS